MEHTEHTKNQFTEQDVAVLSVLESELERHLTAIRSLRTDGYYPPASVAQQAVFTFTRPDDSGVVMVVGLGTSVSRDGGKTFVTAPQAFHQIIEEIAAGTYKKETA